MKKLIQLKPKHLFISILLPFLSAASLLLIVQSAFLYRSYEKKALEMIYDAQLSSLQSDARNVEMMEDTTKSLVTQAFFDSSINALLYRNVDYADYRSYIDRLYFYKNIYPFIYSIYFYNGENIYMMPNSRFCTPVENFYDQQLLDILGDMKTYRSHSLIPRTIPVIQTLTGEVEPGKTVDVYSYLFYQSQYTNGSIQEAIILNVSADWLWKSEQTQNSASGSSTMMIDHTGRLISPLEGHAMLEDLSNMDHVQRVLQADTQAGHLLTELDGDRYFVTYYTLREFGWTLISLTPYAQVVQGISTLRMQTILFVSVLFLLSMVIFALLSTRLYRPITSLIRQSRRLIQQQHQHEGALQQDHLRCFLLNEETSSAADLEQKLAECYLTLNPSAVFRLILIKIDHYHDFCEKYSLNDRRAIRYGVQNMAAELLQSCGEAFCTDMDGNEIAVLLQYSEQRAEDRLTLQAVMEALQHNAQQHLELPLSFLFSNLLEGLDAVDYFSTERLSQYHILWGSRTWVWEDEIPTRTEGYVYSLEKEKQLVENLLLGKRDEIFSLLDEILDDVVQNDPFQLNLTLTRLLTAIAAAVDTLQKSNPELQLSFRFDTAMAQLNQMEYLEEMRGMFRQMFSTIAAEIENGKNLRYEALMTQVAEIIEHECCDPNLSLEAIAEKAGLSPSYLSRLFRRHYQTSITSYINHVRLERAAALLSSTTLPVSEIMQQLGFISQSNFFTLFKKTFGVTPNQYRMSSRKELSDKK